MADPLYDALRPALDVDIFLDLLNKELHAVGEDVRATKARVLDVRYRPQRPCLIAYRVRLQSLVTGRSFRQIFTAEVARPGAKPVPLGREISQRFTSLRKARLKTPEFEIGGPEFRLRPFPIDDAMPWLGDCTDMPVMKHYLNQALGHRNEHVTKVETSVLGYTPNFRAALNYRLRLRSSGSTEVMEKEIIGKTDVHKNAERIFANAWALWQITGKSMPMAEPLGFISPLQMTLQARVPGQRVTDFAGEPEFVALVQQTAQALAKLHETLLPLDLRKDADHELRRLDQWSELLKSISPGLCVRVDQFCSRLSALIAGNFTPSGTTHGDFHPANVLAGGRVVTIVDLDSMAVSDPLVDVGRFLSSLRITALRVTGRLDGLSEAEEAFFESYLRERGPAHVGGVRMYEAAALLVSAATPFRLQREGWQERAAELLGEAESVLNLAEKRLTSSSNPNGSPARPQLSSESSMARATDEIYMRARLQPHVVSDKEERVTSVSVRRLESLSRGATAVRYRVTGRGQRENWRRELVGILSPKTSSGQRNRLESLRQVTRGLEQGPFLANPVCYLRDLRMAVEEAPAGQRLSKLVGEVEARRAFSAAGAALAAVESSGVSVDKADSRAGSLGSMVTEADRLSAARPDLAARTSRVKKAVQAAARDQTAIRAPVLQGLRIESSHWDGGNIVFVGVTDVAMGDPLVPIAAILASLRARQLRKPDSVGRGEAAEALENGYLAASGQPPASLSLYVAAILLKDACRLTRLGRDPSLVTGLVDEANSRIGAA